MARAILIISGKGGVGKTTTAINLASALHSEGKNVLLVDSSISTPDVAIHPGAPVIPVSFHHVLSGRARAKDAVYIHSSGLKILPGSISLQEMKRARPELMKRAVDSLRRSADFLIIDSTAGFGKETLHAIDAASELIIVTNPELPSVTNALKAVKIAEGMGKAVTGTIVTRVSGVKEEMTLDEISEMLETKILGVVPEDSKVKQATATKDILVHAHPKSKAAKAYREIAARLIGKEHRGGRGALSTEHGARRGQGEKREGFFSWLVRKVRFRN